MQAEMVRQNDNGPGTTPPPGVAGDAGGQGPMRGQWALGFNIVRMF